MNTLSYKDIVTLSRLVASARKDNSQQIATNKAEIEKHKAKALTVQDNADLRFFNEKQDYLYEQQTSLYDQHEELIALGCKLSELR
jgi:hypothetical protein